MNRELQPILKQPKASIDAKHTSYNAERQKLSFGAFIRKTEICTLKKRKSNKIRCHLTQKGNPSLRTREITHYIKKVFLLIERHFLKSIRGSSAHVRTTALHRVISHNRNLRGDLNNNKKRKRSSFSAASGWLARGALSL